MKHKPLFFFRFASLGLGLSVLTACGGSSSNPTLDITVPSTQYVVAATAAADFSSGAHSIVSATPPRAAVNNQDASGSDLTIAANGEYFFRIERFGVDTIRKYLAAAPDSALWEFSTNDPSDFSSNVHDMVFVNDSKAYLIRYGTTKVWIVNPSATSESEFKIGELDLTAYADADGNPEMDSAVIVGDKLFITMQRFENFSTLGTAYVAVFDTSTDTEINTGTDTTNGLNGIPLAVKNPRDIEYNADSGLIYVLAGGKLACGFCSPTTPAEYTGGIISLNPATYATSLIVDDGDDSSHPYGNLSTLAIVSETQGYFVGYNAFQDTTLFRFDPSTGNVQATPVASLANMDLTDLGVDREAFLWIGKADNTAPGLIVLDTTDDSISETIGTELNPQSIAFGAIAAP